MLANDQDETYVQESPRGRTLTLLSSNCCAQPMKPGRTRTLVVSSGATKSR